MNHLHAVERRIQTEEYRSRNGCKQQQILVEAPEEVPDRSSPAGRRTGQRKRDGQRVRDRVDLRVDGQAEQKRGGRPSPALQTQQRGQNQDGQQRLRIPTGGHADGQRVEEPQAAAKARRAPGRAAQDQQPEEQQSGQKIAAHEQQLPEVSAQEDVGRQDQRQQRRVAKRGSVIRTLTLQNDHRKHSSEP